MTRVYSHGSSEDELVADVVEEREVASERHSPAFKGEKSFYSSLLFMRRNDDDDDDDGNDDDDNGDDDDDDEYD